MGRIVREHYPVDKLPEDLRPGLALGRDVRVTVEALEPDRQPSSHNSETDRGHFSRFRHLARATFGSAEEIDAYVAEMRAEWDR